MDEYEKIVHKHSKSKLNDDFWNKTLPTLALGIIEFINSPV